MGCIEPSNAAHGPSPVGPPQAVEAQSVGVQDILLCEEGLANLVEIHIAGKDLSVYAGKFNRFDVFSVLYMSDAEQKDWTEVGRTETQFQSCAPVFVKQFTVKFVFEFHQILRVDLMKCVRYESETSDKTYPVGRCVLPLAELVRDRSKTITLRSLDKPEEIGAMTLSAEPVKTQLSSDVVRMVISATGVTSEKPLFFRIFRAKDPAANGGEVVPVYQSEGALADSKREIIWKPVKVGAAALMRDQPTWPIKLELLESNWKGNHQVLGSCYTNFTALAGNVLSLAGGYGQLVVSYAELSHQASFAEYIMNGTNILMGIAVDMGTSAFMMSYKDYGDDWREHPFVKAINTFGSILQMYDTDKNIPVLGFGGIIRGLGTEPQKCFALNGNIFAPEIYTIDRVAKHYIQSEKKLYQVGVPKLAPVISYMGDMAQFYVSSGRPYNYIVMLILTGSELTDPAETADALVRCSSLPMSIIILAVTKDTMEKMAALCPRSGKLKSPLTNASAARNIVHFVPFSQYTQGPREAARLALGAVADQFSEYMSAQKIAPPNVPPQSGTGEYYAARAAKFQESMVQTGLPAEKVRAMIEKGFPTEDPEYFPKYVAENNFCNELTEIKE